MDRFHRFVMGAESIWVVTQGMRMETFRLAEEGKPYPDPEIAHIMYDAAGRMEATYRTRLLVMLVGLILVIGSGTALLIGGEPVLATPMIVTTMISAPFAYLTVSRWRFWRRVRRANTPAPAAGTED